MIFTRLVPGFPGFVNIFVLLAVFLAGLLSGAKFYQLTSNLEELEKKMEQLKAQKKAIQAKQSKLERAQRTRRLIENGALAEKYLRCEKIEPADCEKLLQKLVTIDTVKTIIKGNINE